VDSSDGGVGDGDCVLGSVRLVSLRCGFGGWIWVKGSL
jgi:hypothetical protein